MDSSTGGRSLVNEEKVQVEVKKGLQDIIKYPLFMILFHNINTNLPISPTKLVFSCLVVLLKL